jgi:hypothetical protein
MKQLNRVYDSTLLTSTATYQIDGRLYRYLGRDPYASIQSPKYRFKPLSGQKRRSDLVLNHRQLMLLVWEVPGMTVSQSAAVTEDSVQLGLF